MNAERRAEYEKTLVECCELANQISDELERDVLLRLMGRVQEFIEALDGVKSFAELEDKLRWRDCTNRMNWKRASEITEPGAYWVDDRRPTGTPSASRDWCVVQVRASDRLYVVNENIFLYGPIEPPEMEGKK